MKPVPKAPVFAFECGIKKGPGIPGLNLDQLFSGQEKSTLRIS